LNLSNETLFLNLILSIRLNQLFLYYFYKPVDFKEEKVYNNCGFKADIDCAF